MSAEQQIKNWREGVASIRANPELYQDILDSVMSSMEFEGFTVDRQHSRKLLEQALDGPPLVLPR